jgi:hypothetical protein
MIYSKFKTQKMHEIYIENNQSIKSMRSIRNGDPVYFNAEALKEDEVAMIGSVYLGDPRSEQDLREMDEEQRRLDIIDLRNAPLDSRGKLYAGQVFDPSVNYLVIQGTPDWQNGKGYKGLRSGEVLTVGRKDKVSASRFDLSDPRISGNHMTIYGTDNGLILEDNDSTNGTSYAKYNGEEQQAVSNTSADTLSSTTHETARTESDLARVIDQREVANWQLYMNETKDRQYGTVQDLIERPEFAPVTGVEIEDKTFLFSKIMHASNRKIAIGYVSGGDAPGKIKPRLFYLSDSDGGWRSTPGIDHDGILSKGESELKIEEQDEHGHYVQLTKPNSDIVSVLERQDRMQSKQHDAGDSSAYEPVTYRDLTSIYAEKRMMSEDHSTFADEVSVTEVTGLNMNAYLSGVGAAGGFLSREKLHAMELPVGFEPDFSIEPSKVYRTNHTLAGETSVEVYSAELNGRPIEWHVAHDEAKNRVWIDRIVYKDGKVTTYGTQKEVIVAGALSAKPFDYVSQLSGMREGQDWNRYSQRYGDVSATLDEIPAIKHYRLSRAIYKKY